MDRLNEQPSLDAKWDRAFKRVILGGVSGSGMIGLARMGLQCGLSVSGCDQKESRQVAELKAGGFRYFEESRIREEAGADLVVCSSALPEGHVLRNWARGKNIPVWSRARFLAHLLRDREIILVTGTHGKTTTAVLLAHALKKLGRDCSFYIGAEVPLFNTSAHLGTDALAVVEADESDGSFDEFSPAHVLVLNIEEDHLDHYESIGEIVEAFRSVVNKRKGGLVVCSDDKEAWNAFRTQNNTLWYGFGTRARFRGKEWKATGGNGSELIFRHPEGWEKRIQIGLKGEHNALNVLGVLTMLDSLACLPQDIANLFAGVSGARRRFEIRGASEWGMVIDDYAHHPTEIAATLRAARLEAKGRLICVFQPHRFSRTEKLMGRFGDVFSGADRVYLAPVYGAGEQGDAVEMASTLFREVEKGHCDVVLGKSREEILRALRIDWQRGDHVCFMGAGDVSEWAGKIAEEVARAGELSDLVGDKGTSRLYEPMSKHTTLRVGGPVDAWVTVSSVQKLNEVIYYAKTRTISLKIIGRGTNLLVRDGGIRGICVHLSGGEFEEICINNNRIKAGAGVRLKKLVQAAKKAGLGGFEFMEGIPGNLGGALCMNAGAMQSWMFEVVESVEVLSPDGKIKQIATEEIQVGYRNVPLFDDHVALGAVLVGRAMPEAEIEERLKQFSKKRWASQPAKPSSGCSFKNPENIPAGKLIEELGLKGKKIGGAEISSVHGNFIVNNSKASAEDVLDLIAVVQREAEKKRGIILETEVIILGEK